MSEREARLEDALRLVRIGLEFGASLETHVTPDGPPLREVIDAALKREDVEAV